MRLTTPTVYTGCDDALVMCPKSVAEEMINFKLCYAPGTWGVRGLDRMESGLSVRHGIFEEFGQRVLKIKLNSELNRIKTSK